MSVPLSGLIPSNPSGLTPAQFGALADVPPEIEWLANITNPKTKRAYRNDAGEFFAFAGLKDSAALRAVTRAHVIAWRKDLEARRLAPSSVRRKLSAVSSLFEYLCERNAVLGNPVDGVKRPAATGNEGSTPALGDAQARKLLDAPPENTLKGKRDRAILAPPFITASAAKSSAGCA
jgi:site-specific recombinase XerD